MSAELTNPATAAVIASALQLPIADRVQIITAIKRSLADKPSGHASTDQSTEAAS